MVTDEFWCTFQFPKDRDMKKLLLVVLLLSAMVGKATPRLPHIFGDGMVLQRDMPITIWGWADKNETITVSFHEQSKKVKAAKDGRWLLKLNPEAAGGPYVLEVRGKSAIILKNVLVGEVWVCSGQSNMEWPVAMSNQAADVIAASANDEIRHFEVAKAVAGEPLDDVQPAVWKKADPANTGSFTAVGYFFARVLQAKLKVPIGLIHSSWGGTDVETWISRDAFQQSDEFAATIGKLPSLNLDSMMKLQAKATDALVQSIQGNYPPPARASGFSARSIDDSKWPLMTVPGFWEEQQLKTFDGIVWLRREITLDAATAASVTKLLLGKIDDNDQAWINGVPVGGTNGYNLQRAYAVPAGVLKEGKNTIAVRVEDTGGGGGIWGEPETVGLVADNKLIPLAGSWKFQVEKAVGAERSVGPNSYPSLLYNAMINPLINYGIRGAIWYQGENNAGRAAQYAKAFPLLINDWRKKWNEADFPFYFVQLSSFISLDGDSQKGSTWAELRESQTATRALPNTGMAVTIDIGERNDIHPRNKQDVGARLAAIALKQTYKLDMVAGGPAFSGFEVQGNKVFVSYSETGSGLSTPDKYGYLRGFEIAGADQQFHYARGWIENGKVVLESAAVSQPVAVRYAWADDAGDANLFNKEGFPAEPFRTDKWKSITGSVKYTR